MRRKYGVKATFTSRDQASTSDQAEFRVPACIQWLSKHIGSSLKRSKTTRDPKGGLPSYNTPAARQNGGRLPSPGPSPPPPLHLMACIHTTRYRVGLVQEEVQGINSDRALFRFLRRQFETHRGRYLGFIAVRRVRQILFVKVSYQLIARAPHRY
jgi:hypothetical protein